MRRWDVIERLIKDNSYKSFVEVGTKEGRLTSHILANCPDTSVIGMDPWKPMPENAGRVGGETYAEWDFKDIEQTFWSLVEPNKDRLTFYRKTSEEVAERVPDHSMDLVFIDAAHDYDNVLHDIHLWAPKVRIGGILSGHDYQHKFPGVMRAIAKSFNLMDIQMEEDSVWWIRL